MRGLHRSNARTRTRTDLCHRLAELFTRQIQSERQCSAIAPGLDSARRALKHPIAPLSCERPSRVPPLADPLCIGLPATRSDTRVLSHADSAAAAHEVLLLRITATTTDHCTYP